MQKRTKATLILALAVGLCLGAFFYFQVQPTTAASPHRVHADPIWQITQPGTDRIVEWVDAANPRFAVYDPEGDSDRDDPNTWVDDAVLDKETGLVWERSPDDTLRDWYSAKYHCYHSELANRKGWRLPTVEELLSLVDTVNEDPALPTGHPFINVQLATYWSSTTAAIDNTRAWGVYFRNGNFFTEVKSHDNRPSWYVRGGQGHDAY